MGAGRGGTATCFRVAGVLEPATAAATMIAVMRVGRKRLVVGSSWGWRCFHSDDMLTGVVIGVDNFLNNDTNYSGKQARMRCMHEPSIQNADLAKTKGLAPNRRH